MALYREKDESLLTVSSLTAELKRFVSGRFRDVRVEGEISNAKLYPSGHFYFTLKDDAAMIRGVFFNYANRVSGGRAIKDGDKVLCRGRIDIYEKRGEYQIIVSDLVSRGDQGQAYLKFLELKEKLFKEGLFDEAFKRPIPVFPRSIGIVTSPAGAAIRDMLRIIHERFGNIPVQLCPASVQGEMAALEIVEGIRHFNETKEVDVIIIGRGGGSYEDLCAFNEEILARAIFESTIPIVSAVGHEIDFTIADFVADVRAATPTAAAAIVCPGKDDILNYLSGMKDALHQAMRRKLEKAKYDFVREVMEFKDRKDYFASYKIYLDDLGGNLEHNLENYMIQARTRYETLSQRLVDLNPAACLERGYSITTKRSTGEVITDSSHVTPGDALTITLHKGSLEAVSK
ncbi:MAG: exodeoxyribonuclease VII large subunit [Syntrophorhabdaceae bacterium]